MFPLLILGNYFTIAKMGSLYKAKGQAAREEHRYVELW